MQRLAALALTSALALGGAVGCTTAASAADSVTVKGHVTSPTGKAVGGVRVSLRAKPRFATQYVSRVVRTSGTGRYEVHVPRGEFYDLRVSDPGDDDRDTADGEWAPTYRRITSTASSIRVNQVVHHGAQVSGRVYDSSGAAVKPGSVVSAYRRVPQTDGRSPLDPLGSTYTIAGGAYHFRNLPETSVILSFAPPTENDSYRFRTGQAGGSTSFADASEVDTIFGVKNTGLSFRFPVRGVISGTMTLDGKPLPGDDGRTAALSLLDSSGAELDRESVESVFRFPDLAAGTYRLHFVVTESDGTVVADEYYSDAATLAASTAIQVGNGEAVTGLKVALNSR